MAPTLPSSLSPHICLLTTPDVDELFEASGLPPLPQTLQSFVPLPQVTTRTTSLASIPHSSFPLRFSDLAEIETAAHEDEESRAGRTMDWIGQRTLQRTGGWVQMLQAHAAGGQNAPAKEGVWRDKTPWWEELKRCIEGDHVPHSDEGWNHPVSIIMTVSTRAVNPLQALQDLNARPLDLPPWVEPTHLRYYLIIHPADSPLTEPIAEALFNAVRKQYGLQTYMLRLTLPTNPPPTPVPIPSIAPRLPPPPVASFDTPPLAPRPAPAGLGVLDTPRPTGHTIALSEGDIHHISKFVREYVVMSLIPWMEKCVMDWNENFSSSRRLPSRLFSSTRRLFGSSATTSSASSTASPAHGSNASVSSISSRFTSHAPNTSVGSLASVSSTGTTGGSIVTQQRRLAEFATMLGDYKLATMVWESLRKEGRGGSDILPLLLSPTPALALHAQHALSTLRARAQNQAHSHITAHTQLRALSYAENDGLYRLLVVLFKADDPPTTLLLAHAAFLSEKKGCRRRSALWYLLSADRLEKAGNKPLAMHLFRKAHELYKTRSEKEVSSSFWESEGVDPSDWRGFEAVLPGIEHELGRLLYTTGDTEGAVRYFLGLLRGTAFTSSQTGADTIPEGQISTDKVYLEDFRVALKHFKATEREKWAAAALKLPVTFCQAKQTRIRYPGENSGEDRTDWAQRENDWTTFWAHRGKERLERSISAAVDENFWVDVVMQNPLDVEVTLSGLTVNVREASPGQEPIELPSDSIETEIVDDIILGARETRTIPVAVRCRRPASLIITEITYDFLSLLPTTESLAVRGRRLHDTAEQRQNKVYAPDTYPKVDVEEAGQRLHASFVDDTQLVLAHGESRRLRLWMTNSGTRKIGEIWMVTGHDDNVWVESMSEPSSSREVLHTNNSLAPRTPYRIPLDTLQGSSEIAPGDSLQFNAMVHASSVGEQTLALLIVFREGEGLPFHCTRATRQFEVKPIVKTLVTSVPSGSLKHSFLLNVEVDNITDTSTLRIAQVTTMSQTWSCIPLARGRMSVPPYQSARFTFGVSPWKEGPNPEESMRYVSAKLRDVLHGRKPVQSGPPSADIICEHTSESGNVYAISTPAIRYSVHCDRRAFSSRLAASSHPYIPADSHHFIFPLYNPYSLDVLLFWQLPLEGRFGHILIPGLKFGACHAFLKGIAEEAENAKVKRSMYAETQRERSEILRAVRDSEWNEEMDPVVVTVSTECSVEHDFSSGPCNTSVAFTLRNLSLTNPCRVLLKLPSNPRKPSTSDLQSPQYAGRLVHRGVLNPLESTTFHVKVWIPRPGTFALDGWSVETEVGEAPLIDQDPAGSTWKSRQLRYVQGPPDQARTCITVIDNTPSR
ncbi:hypothetical protein WOLCODRAFT_60797 [Wolfiporia cocos MD-104 SS10]|uniref:TPPC8 first Ig-like domain-containing protein n=1 Tax=Wolfiporia cocos (strain MD-104) TaxID=742152 RepID=A0A2H3J7Z1_WOLCO|nr:hypothetical protein WOLCODRAFT_60797 [Wolfiporia cocos MD-104 SS10]